VFIDAHYQRRAFEVFDFCATSGGFPTFGEASLKYLPWRRHERDPYEGKAGQGRTSLACITFQPDIFKTLTYDLLNARSEREWLVYTGIEREYVTQMTAEQQVNGVWELRRNRRDNHLWDCEVLQTLAAHVYGVLRSEWLDARMAKDAEKEGEAK
jgi:hypothetical protein